MKVQIKRIDPLRAATICAALYAVFGLVAVLFLVPAALLSARGPDFMALAIAIVFPFMYIVAGFIVTYLCALLYNFITRWTGGILLTLELEEVSTNEVKP